MYSFIWKWKSHNIYFALIMYISWLSQEQIFIYMKNITDVHFLFSIGNFLGISYACEYWSIRRYFTCCKSVKKRNRIKVDIFPCLREF